MMAFANEAVQSWKSVNYTNEQILNKLRKPFVNDINPSRNESFAFDLYLTEFNPYDKYITDKERDEDTLILKRFLNYMAAYAQEMNYLTNKASGKISSRFFDTSTA